MMDSVPIRARPASIGAGLTLPATLQVRNVVASARVAGALRLHDLAATVPGAEFDPSFPRLILRLSAPKASALIFSSGKVVLTGMRSPETVAPALAAVLDVLRGAGAELDRPVPAPRIVNLVASGTLGEKVALHRLAISRDLDRIEFDPEMFSGLVYRSEAGGVALVFGTGSLVVTGTRSLEGARAVAAEVRAIVTAAGASLK
ncbi:MAG TPA: TATA-box-binding protein [Methanoregulaceae archaeon]|nr:TATA-box-binding protein [Methanoregulaceae archaeon]